MLGEQLEHLGRHLFVADRMTTMEYFNKTSIALTPNRATEWHEPPWSTVRPPRVPFRLDTVFTTRRTVPTCEEPSRYIYCITSLVPGISSCAEQIKRASFPQGDGKKNSIIWRPSLNAWIPFEPMRPLPSDWVSLWIPRSLCILFLNKAKNIAAQILRCFCLKGFWRVVQTDHDILGKWWKLHCGSIISYVFFVLPFNSLRLGYYI